MPAGGLAAALTLAAAVIAMSWAAILIRLCDAPSLGIALYRLVFATLVLAPWAWRGARGSARVHGLAIVAGALLALHFASWISSLAYTSVASSVMLVATIPVFTAVLGPLYLGERPGPAGLFGMLLALGGIVVLAGEDFRAGGAALWGDLLALGGALTGAVYLMIGRRVRERIAFAPYLLIVNGSAAACLALMALVSGVELSGYPAATWGLLALLAAGPHLVGHGLLNWSVRRMRSFTVALATLGEPVLATIYAAILFGEIPGATFYLGGALIAGGILLALREEARLVRR